MKTKSQIKEYGDLGQNLGNISSTSGMINPGVSTFASPSVSQNPINFFSTGPNTIDTYNSFRATGPDDAEIDKIKTKVTPDEVLCGLDYELKRMFFKNKSHAKELVIINLKKDPEYYSKLHMLNLDDKLMTEKKTTLEIINGLSERMKKNQTRSTDSRISEAYKNSVETFNRKRKYVETPK